MLKVIADTGKSHFKYLVLDEEDNEILRGKFSSNVQTNKISRLGDDTHLLRHGNETYLVGDNSCGINSNQLELDKRTTENKISIYTVIALALKKLKRSFESHVLLVINLPLSQFKDKDIRQSYCQYYLKDTIVVQLDEDKHHMTFNIKQVIPAFESMGCLLRNGESWRDNGETIIFDWGGLNLTYTTLDDQLKPVTTKCDSLFAGSHLLLNEVQRRLASIGHRYDHDAISRFILRKKQTENETLLTFIDNVVEDFIQTQILNKLDHLDLTERLVFTGGTSLLCERYLRQLFQTHPRFELSSNCEYDNVLGFSLLVRG